MGSQDCYVTRKKDSIPQQQRQHDCSRFGSVSLALRMGAGEGRGSALEPNPGRGSWQGWKAPDTLATGGRETQGYDCARVGNKSGWVRMEVGIQLLGRARQLAPSIHLEVGRKAGCFSGRGSVAFLRGLQA